MEWSIQDLGAVGEFVGALIIVVTLVYLAIQNKQNQKLLLSNAFQARANTVIDLYREAAMSPDFAAIFERNAAGEILSPEETRRITWFQLCILKSAENVQFQLQLGVLGSDYGPIVDENLRAARSSPQMRATYEANRTMFNQPFRAVFDDADG
jgi:hypothetical protein